MADPSLQWDLSSIDQLMTHSLWDDDLNHSISTDSYYRSYPSASISSNIRGHDSSIDSSRTESCLAEARSKKIPRTAILPSQYSSSPSILSFGSPNSHEDSYADLLVIATVNPEERLSSLLSKRTKKTLGSASRPSSLNHDHVLAERKRRERLSQKFIALSAMIPGLKKIDKASVLGDAIRYLKTLQEKVKSLEEQAAKKRAVGSSDFARKPRTIVADYDKKTLLPTGEVDGDDRSLPEVEVKLADKTVLIKMFCEDRKGMLARVLCEVEKLPLVLVSTSAIPFATSSVDITIIAQASAG